MKAALSITAVVCVAALAVFLRRPAEPVRPSPASVPAKFHGPAPTSINADPAEVFQRAFWRRPSEGDRIEAAERREWADDNGVQKWQWFIRLKPSAGLVKHLREENAFDLRPAAETPVIEDAPSWFSFKNAEVEILENSSGQMRLVFSKEDNVLFATDSGNGFKQGVSLSPPPASAPSAIPGRLPITSPPKSNP